MFLNPESNVFMTSSDTIDYDEFFDVEEFLNHYNYSIHLSTLFEAR